MHLLKQSTAATVIVGPVLDSSGAAVTTAVVGDFRLAKEGTSAVLSGATVTHDANGYYLIALTTTNTNTVGRLAIYSNNTAQSMGTTRFMVLLPSVYDALVTNATNATGGLPAATGQITALAGEISTFAGGAVASVTGNVGGNVSGSVNSVVSRVTANTDQWGGLNVTGMPLPTSSYTAPDNAGIGTLLTRMTASRALYLDNLNVGGPVASQSDINALNQSASRRLILTTLQQLERPESGSASYQIEARTFDGDGAAVNADSTPTLTATGILSGSLAANLSAATNPATGVYRWTYSVVSGATQEQIRFDLSAVLSASTFTIAAFSSVVDLVSATWTSTDATRLTAIYNKLPSRAYLTGATSSTGELVPGDILNQLPTAGWTNGSFGDRLLVGANNNREVFVTGSQHVAADVHAFQSDVITSAATDASFVAEIQSGLSTLTGPDVRAEVMDVLTSEVFAELSAIPGANSTILERISLLFMLARNKMTQTSTLQTLFADDGTTAIGTASVSDNGTTFTKGELG